jgi:photosystem II stability/assembly factor-like uncharacterized protein
VRIPVGVLDVAARRSGTLLGGSQNPRRRFLLMTVIAVLVLTNMVLVSSVLDPPRSDVAAGGRPVIADAHTDPVGPTAPERAPSAELAPPLDIAGRVIVRGTTTSCDTAAGVLYRSDDGGENWREISTPARSVLRVHVADARSTWFIGTDSGCRSRLYLSADSGRTWQMSSTTDGFWHRMPAVDSRTLHTPVGTVGSPCESPAYIRQVAAIHQVIGAVVCTDGDVYWTSTGGRSWWRIAALAGTQAVAFPEEEVGVAAGTADGCQGVSISRSIDRGLNWTRAGCVLADTDATATMSFDDPDHGLLVAGRLMFGTSDGGLTWRECGTPRRFVAEAETVTMPCL